VNHGDSSRVVEARCRARAVGKGGAATACERCDNTKGRHESDAVIVPVSHDDHAARGNHGDSPREREARGCARAVGKSVTAAARERRDDAKRRHKPYSMVPMVNHDENATRRDHGDSCRALEARVSTSAIGEAISTARERCGNAKWRHKTNSVIVRVSHDDHAA
jgi:hypothetical protein